MFDVTWVLLGASWPLMLFSSQIRRGWRCPSPRWRLKKLLWCDFIAFVCCSCYLLSSTWDWRSRTRQLLFGPVKFINLLNLLVPELLLASSVILSGSDLMRHRNTLVYTHATMVVAASTANVGEDQCCRQGQKLNDRHKNEWFSLNSQT